MANLMITWHSISSASYNALPVKDDNALYFLNDTREIFKGEVSYTESVIMVVDFPAVGARNKLYVKKSDLEMKVYDGTSWIPLSKPISNVLDSTTDYDDMLITGAGIKLYVDEKIEEIISTGGVTAKTVKTSESFQVKGTSIGAYKDGDVISDTESVFNILKNILTTVVPPTYKSPTVRLGYGSSVEAGSTISPTITPSFTQNDAGDISRYSLTRTTNSVSTPVIDSAAITSYTQDPIAVGDSGITYTATVTYAEGPIKNDNLGNPYPTGHIAAGSVSDSMSWTGFRKAFYGTDSDKTAECETSDDVRALPLSSSGKAPTGTNCITININIGDTRVTIAYPATYPDISKVVQSSLGWNVLDTFTKKSIMVEGANGYDAVEYKVYSYIPDVPFPTAETYLVSI